MCVGGGGGGQPVEGSPIIQENNIEFLFAIIIIDLQTNLKSEGQLPPLPPLLLPLWELCINNDCITWS